MGNYLIGAVKLTKNIHLNKCYSGFEIGYVACTAFSLPNNVVIFCVGNS